MEIEWKDMDDGRRFHASIGRFAAEVWRSSEGRWVAEVGLADARDPYWMTVILAKIGSWKDSLATADEAKRWAIEALVALMGPIAEAIRIEEREKIARWAQESGHDGFAVALREGAETLKRSPPSIYVYRDHSAGYWVATPRSSGPLRPIARGATPEAAKEALRAVMEELRAAMDARKDGDQ